MSAPAPAAGALLPNGYPLRLAARQHPGMLWESTVRPVLAHVRLPAFHMDGTQLITVGDTVDSAQARRLMDLDLAFPAHGSNGIERIGPTLDQLTVVIPVHGRSSQLDRLLGMISSSGTESERPRVLVVNDATPDPTELFEVTRRHRVEQIDLPTNLGPGGARNAGLAQVSTEYTAFLDSDITVSLHQLDRLLQEFSDPLLAIVAPRMVGSKEHNGHFISRYEEQHGSLDLGALPGLVGPNRRLTYVPSACWVCRTAAVRPGFDLGLRVGEDVDLVWRLAGQGWTIRFIPQVRAQHDARKTLASWSQQHHGYGLSSAPLALRHGARIAPARYTLTGAVVAASMMAPWPIFAATMTAAWLISETRVRRRLGQPRSVAGPASRLAWTGVSANLRQTSSLITRYWLPVVLPVALASTPARRLLTRSLLCDAFYTSTLHSSATETAPSLRPRHSTDAGTQSASFGRVLTHLRRAITLVPLRTVENTSFSLGVLRGCWTQRTLSPLVPDVRGHLARIKVPVATDSTR
ncbi:MAG: glycosyltransferase [Micrococcaceae bacterium]